MTTAIKTPKKLIEVALPLDSINEAAAREKSIRHGHPSTLHLWWARRPLAAARAVIFAQMVNDPSWKWELEHPGEVPPSNLKASWAASRKRLFCIIEDLVKWESTSNEDVLAKARAEIRKSWLETCEANKTHPQAAQLFNPESLPFFHDPFAGGGTLPLEAQRLGLSSYATDLNPVPVLINKAMIEMPPKFSGMAPVNRESRQDGGNWSLKWNKVQGLEEDVRYYGQWMHIEARKRLEALYPPINVAEEAASHRPELKSLVGQKLRVIAWIWARTVRSPSPAFSHVQVPLVSSFVLAQKPGKEAWISPSITGDSYTFEIKNGPIPPEARLGTKAEGKGTFRCILSGAPISTEFVKQEATAGRMGNRLLAVVAEGTRRRIYLPASPEQEQAAQCAAADWAPDLQFAHNSRHLTPWAYGLDNFSRLFSSRQLKLLSTLSELVGEVRIKVEEDAKESGVENPSGYADAVAIYMAIFVSRMANLNNAMCQWRSDPAKEHVGHMFSRQAIPMVWDFAEANPFGGSAGDFEKTFEFIPKVLPFLPGVGEGFAIQADAQSQMYSQNGVISTDPPYYDNVPYADLSDFFYVWLRKSLRNIEPQLFATMAVPKAEELVADSLRHKGKSSAEEFFLNGMREAMRRLAEQSHPAMPITIYYAFKQSETKASAGTSSSGWETFLSAVISSGLAITGTWPVRTELGNRMRSSDSNALASSIVLVCRARVANAPIISRRAFLRELNQTLPAALDEMTRGSGDERSPVAPVDLSQAIIGPGMAVFSKYAAVLEADGSAMTVQAALQLINSFLAEDDFDHDTQFCLHWFEQYGWKEGRFGEADTLARAKGTSVDGVKQAGVLVATGGIVRLLKWMDYPSDWDVEKDERLPIWELLHQLIRLFKTEGETDAGKMLAAVADKAEVTRQLAYRLYTLCERAGWAEDARAYNEIVTSWSAIESAAAAAPKAQQTDLFE